MLSVKLTTDTGVFSISVQDAACPGITHKYHLRGLSLPSPHPGVLSDAFLCL